jgi:hypothetical protein
MEGQKLEMIPSHCEQEIRKNSSKIQEFWFMILLEVLYPILSYFNSIMIYSQFSNSIMIYPILSCFNIIMY